VNLDGNQASIQEAVDNGALRRGDARLAGLKGVAGQRDRPPGREAGLPMQRDTIFRVASMTKPVTVAAAMTLWSRGPGWRCATR
jgi:CubicO group peptidase (beta-lactamase class C family)